MIIVTATVRVHPDKAGAYEEQVARVMPPLRDANPGILFYHCARDREAPLTYRVVEAYADEAAMAAHVASELLKESFAGLQDIVAGIDIAISDAIV